MSRILLVDDELDLLDAIRGILEDEGYEVSTAGDGRQALDQLEASNPKPDLLLLDVMMPIIDGLQVLERVRTSDRLKDLPVVMMSAVNPESAGKHARWDAFLNKPFSLDDLLDTVKKHVSRAR